MMPKLRRRAQLVLATALTFLAAGATLQAPVMLALGAAVLIALVALYVTFLPTAIYLRRKKIDVAWYAKDATLAPGGMLPLELTIRNHGFRLLYIRDLRPVTAAAIRIHVDATPAIAAGHQAVIATPLRALAFGRWCIHGCELHFRDAFDLFEVGAYFPSFFEVRVAPNQSGRSRGDWPLARFDFGHHSARSRRVGQGDEIYELREYKPGDPFRAINWKASARQRQLVTREMESHQHVSEVFVLDVGAAMREGPIGESLLDVYATVLWHRATALLAGGHRVGVVTFDSQPLWHLALGDTTRWRRALAAMLAELPHLTAAATTDAQPAYVVDVVAQYLLEQTGHSFRTTTPPALDASRWTNLHIGASGEFFDLGQMLAYVQTLQPATADAAPWRLISPTDPDPTIALLRDVCRWRCLPLPPLKAPPPGARAQALVEALRIAANERPSQISILSGGHGLLEATQAVATQLRALRRQGITVNAGKARPMTVPIELDPIGRAAWDILSRQRHQAAKAAQQTWRALGL